MQSQSRAIIFARVSSKAQEDEGYSLDSQLKLLRGYCQSNELTIVKEFRITETASKQQHRKAFHDLLIYIAKERICHFVVEKTDRLTRNYKDAASIDDWLENDERRVLHIVKENLQISKNARSHAKFMWGFMIAWAKQYTDNLREEAMKGWAEKLAQGWMPAPPPVGYMTVTENGKRIHVPDPATMQTVRRVFELYLLPDQSLRTLCAEIPNLGLVSRKGRPFAMSKVCKMLDNPFYIGTIRFNGKEYPGAQEPIISRQLFEDVQKKLHRSSQGRRRKHNPLFQGLIRCADCGHMVTWQLQKGRYYGHCQRSAEACKRRRWLREDRVEAEVIRALEKIKDPDGKILEKIKAALEVSRNPYVGLHREKVIEALHRQLNRLESMQARLYDDRLSDLVVYERYRAKSQNLNSQIVSIRERLEELCIVAKNQRLNFCSVHSIGEFYARSYSLEERRTTIEIVLKSLIVAGDGIECKRQL